MGYALGNLFTDIESLDPRSTPAMEVRVTPSRNLGVKSIVEAKDRAIAPPHSIEQVCATRPSEKE